MISSPSRTPTARYELVMRTDQRRGSQARRSKPQAWMGGVLTEKAIGFSGSFLNLGGKFTVSVPESEGVFGWFRVFQGPEAPFYLSDSPQEPDRPQRKGPAWDQRLE